ncbi:hypothetical protein TPHA_0D04450 [Tetrapisispora phaffii CBS 4417]|uniref:Ras-GEF domain-containing protein n=1 Tax=Tetrapisispora phaffii (strain ATCC 24235 / CBS 4417 / NBRC 1672 / NRRL Y-8282 / UCD 70-5) TaxID=1071381 RepID=G8BS04_TETPH|nr:hypothetical protein TPHA_0D04450 [Tetrapisispora phaffii CBS 4417]CCE63079.1 hypothetical protein TPHA_0D04450 [Tetrapisispora phaffii CBS 4417]
MNPDNRESHISTTTPLFGDKKNSVFLVSPTKSLSYVRKSGIQTQNNNVDNETDTFMRSGSLDTLSSKGDSFITAYSAEHNSSNITLDNYQDHFNEFQQLQETNSDNNLYFDEKIITENSLLENESNLQDNFNFDIDATPLVKGITNKQDISDITTPILPRAQNNNRHSFENEHSIVERQYINTNGKKISGLGLSTASLDMLNNSISIKDRDSILKDTKGASPTRAVRTSMLVNEYTQIIPDSVTPEFPLPDDRHRFVSNANTENSKAINQRSSYITNDSANTSDEYIKNNKRSTFLSDKGEYDNRKPSAALFDETKKTQAAPSNDNIVSAAVENENLAFLFIVATHSFDSTSLNNTDDESICLSFRKDDVAFVHTVDESGWGEVTLVKNQARGWVPFNYFSDLVKSENYTKKGTKEDTSSIVESRKPLEDLLNTCARFLLYPQDEPLEGTNEFTFNIEYVNSIRNGVRTLLELTECVSRSNELIQSSYDLRRARKKLLADWYNLMIKSDHYKHTTSNAKIGNLITLVYEVLKRAFTFYVVWTKVKATQDTESASRRTSMQLNKLPESEIRRSKSIHRRMEYLDTPPNATIRLHEIYDILFRYIGLLLGRLDIIEHNPNSCETLEYIVLQMIILLRELLYISKSCATIIQQKYHHTYENHLDESLDPLLSFVSILVSCIKQLVTQILNEDYEKTATNVQIRKGTYFYTDEGKHLMMILSSMAPLISSAVACCGNYIRIIGDFQLGSDRKYPNFKKIRITPEEFIKKCSNGIVSTLNKATFLGDESTKDKRQKSIKEMPRKRISRYSTIRVGDNSNFCISPEGTQFLQELMPEKPFSRDSIFAKFKIEDNETFDDSQDQSQKDQINNREVMMDQIMIGPDENIIGASFKSLVFKLTDEVWKVDDFFIATVLLNFRTFGTTVDLIDLLICRFDVNNTSSFNEHSKSFSTGSAKLKLRRKLVCKIFQTWMESYWDYESDFDILATIINFFNEGISVYLPIEAKNLIEVAAKLFVAAGNSNSHYFRTQIKSIVIPYNAEKTNTSSVISSTSTDSTKYKSSLFSVDDRLIEEYELTHVIEPPNQNSFSLPIPILNIGRSALLSKYNIQDMESAVRKYRSFRDNALSNTETRQFEEQSDLEMLIKEWNEMVKNDHHLSKYIHLPLNLVDLNPLEVAKQLTIIESKLYLSIEPFELVNDNFLEKKRKEGLAPNVNLIIDFTNQLSHYVIEGILSPNLSNQSRAVRLKGWLKIALSVLYFRNFNSVASIMTALQNHVITRLTDIWELLDEKDMDLFDYLSRIIHPNNNFKVYRKKLNSILEGDTAKTIKASKCSLPVVPFFNLFLQDLTFISEGNPNYRNANSFRPDKTINIDKYFKISKSICMVQFFQVPYETRNLSTPTKRESFFSLTEHMDVDTNCIAPIPLLQEFILDEFWRVNTLYSQKDDRAYELSLQLKPKN